MRHLIPIAMLLHACEEPGKSLLEEAVDTAGFIGDADGDGTTNVDDLLIVISSWGPCQDCAADFDLDDRVHEVARHQLLDQQLFLDVNRCRFFFAAINNGGNPAFATQRAGDAAWQGNARGGASYR